MTEAITDTSFTVAIVSGQEYSLNNGDWIHPTGATYTWTGLKQSTRYTLQTRTAETADTMPSAAVTTYVTTFTKHTLTDIQVDLFKMAITELEAGMYSINGGIAIEVKKNGLLDVEDYFGRTVQLRRLGSVETQTVDSDPVSVDIISHIAAPTAQQANMDAVRATLNGFVIVAPDPRLEYQILDTDGFAVTDWKSVAGEDIVFSGLQHSTAYLIQAAFKPTDTDPKSNAYISDPIYTLFYEDTPAATVDTVAHCLTDLVPGAAYLINGTAYVASEQGTVPVSNMWIDSEILIVKCGDSIKTVDSAAQSLLLPGRVPTKLQGILVQHVTYYDGNNGVITGVTEDMEYSTDGGKTWIAVNGQKLEGLAVSEYRIRYRAQTAKYFAGEEKYFWVSLDEVVAKYKDQVIDELERSYDKMAESLRYNDPQLDQLRTILDHGIDNIKTSMATVDDVDKAKDTVLENMGLVPCSNVATEDGKLVGEDITSDTVLQYPNDSDVIWGNVANDEGLDSDLAFVIRILGKSDTTALQDRYRAALSQGTLLSTDPAVDAQTLKTLLHNTQVKLGMDITIARDAIPTDQFKGTYRVTVLLPIELQGMEELNIISVDENGAVSYHPATVIGNYLTFETSHFSIYGVIGQDELAIAKEETLQKISDLSDDLDADSYTRDNWEKLHAALLSAITRVSDAQTVQEIADAWTELMNTVEVTPMKRSLGWLWLLMLLVVLLAALIVVCYLVWQVHYYDGEEQLHQKFHFWGTKVTLWNPEKEGFVPEGWYYDPELTDRAEDNFRMPWHSVKLYAKWTPIEILSEPEDEPVVEERAEEAMADASTENTDAAEKEAETQELTVLESSEEMTESEEEYLAAAEEDVTEDDLAELALLDAPPADEDADLLEAPDEQKPALLNAPADENEDAEKIDALPEHEKEAVALLEAADESDVAMLEAAEKDDVLLLNAPADHPDNGAMVVVGEILEDTADEEDPQNDEMSYRDSESYQAWLQFGDGEEEESATEEPNTGDGDEVQLFVNEKTGEKYHIRFNLSFRAKMTSLSDEAKGFYRELKDEFLTYKGVKTRISWKAEGVRKGRETLARFAVRDGSLCVFLALDPDAYRDSKYVFESVKDIKAYEAVPMLIRVKSDLSCRKVKELIADMMAPKEVKRLDAAPETDYSFLDEDSSTEARLRAGQLRIWAEGPDDQVCANRAAAATLHYLISPEATAQEAEALISDEMLDALMPPAQDILIVADQVGEVSLEQLCKKFYVGDTVDIAAMKEKDLVAPEVNYVKITSQGDMTKRLTVSAHMFERTAAKMILLTGGDVEVMTE